MRRKSSTPLKRIEGELPSAPVTIESMADWWDETTTVLDRVRAETNKSLNKVENLISSGNIKKLYEDNGDTNSFSDYHKDRLEHLEDALGIEGNAVGTETKQELNNKTTDGGYF
jgi:hypothetical protein